MCRLPGSPGPDPVPAGGARKRGFTLMETVLVIAAGLGLLIGGIMFYRQAEAASDHAEKTRAAIAISAEVRAMYREAPNTTTILKEDVMAWSSLPDSTFRGIDVIPHPLNNQRFMLVIRGLSPKVCQTMSANPGDLGTGVVAATTVACDVGALNINYQF